MKRTDQQKFYIKNLPQARKSKPRDVDLRKDVNALASEYQGVLCLVDAHQGKYVPYAISFVVCFQNVPEFWNKLEAKHLIELSDVSIEEGRKVNAPEISAKAFKFRFDEGAFMSGMDPELEYPLVWDKSQLEDQPEGTISIMLPALCQRIVSDIVDKLMAMTEDDFGELAYKCMNVPEDSLDAWCLRRLKGA